MSIITPRKNIIVPVEIGMAGLFRLQVRRPDGRVRVDTGFFPNLITDWGLNAKGDTEALAEYYHVGSGNTAPSVSDVNLQSWIASTRTIPSASASSQGAQGSPPYYGWYRATKRFAEGDAQGTIAEVGVGPLIGSTTELFSRALVLDGLGNPTTITVLSDEVLDVTYEIRAYPPTVDGSFTGIDGYDITTRASDVTAVTHWGTDTILDAASWQSGGGSDRGAYSGTIGTITQRPSGTVSQSTGFDFVTYANNSLEREGTVNFGLESGNFVGGIKSIYLSSRGRNGAWQMEFDPAIPKDNTKVLSVTVKVGWGRAAI